MSTLLMHLAGPLQSWGTWSRFRERDTGLEPSKSGVIGLLCAALGKPRDERPDDQLPALAALAGLRMGVRVDLPGVMLSDYQTAGGTHRWGDSYGVAKADGKGVVTAVSRRYFLADAAFLVGLEGDPGLLARLDAALARPHWQICLGRKAFVPGVPVRLPDQPPWGPGLRPGTMEEAFATTPWLGQGDPPDRVRVVHEAVPGPGTEIRQDHPISFADRRFGPRHVQTGWIPVRPRSE